jgi:hypothetical protein
MNIVKLFVSLMILFVVVNFAVVIYNFLNRKWREGLENAEGPAANSATTSKTGATTKSTVCPNGCIAPTELSGNCDSLQKDASGNYYKSCPYECAKTFGTGCDFDQQCTSCGAYKVTGLWDKNGNYIGQDESVQKTSGSGVADNAQTAGVNDGTLDNDTATVYSDAVTGTSSPAAVQTACDVLAIHNSSAHNSTYGQWFPASVSNMNLSQTSYEHAGRKFLNEESIKKGVQTPLIMASEAEVLGRLLWRVHLAAITQNCMNNTPTSVQTTMQDELALMKKVHEIQNVAATSSLQGCDINSTCQPKQTANCPTTGMMTQTPSSSSVSSDNRPSATSSINSTVPSMLGTGSSTSYTTDYQPRNPNLKPKPYNSIWDIF